MLIHKRFVTLAVTAAVAIVPAVAVQSAEARVDTRIRPAELCHPKWVLPPQTTTFQDVDSDMPSTDDLDVQNPHASGEDQDWWATETVEHDDLTYDGC
jgi:hypothetical protein